MYRRDRIRNRRRDPIRNRELNRVDWARQGSANGWIYAYSCYQYDKVGREVATWRAAEGDKGERFSYTTTNQLQSASYNADQVWMGSGLNATRNVTYELAPLNRN